MVKRLLRRINLWRHVRGFGVHSPFGYELVTRAVRAKGCAWYGYADIDATFPGRMDRCVRREARMLLRFMTMLRPRSAYIPVGVPAAYQAAIRAADSRIAIRRDAAGAKECELICSFADHLPEELLAESLKVPGHWVALKNCPRDWDRLLFDALPEGLMLVGRRNVFLLHRPGMMKIRYSMPV